MLEALDRELQADWRFRDLQLQVAFASHFSTKSVKQTLQSMQNTVAKYKRLALFEPEPAQGIREGTLGSVDSVIKLYHALSAVGILDPLPTKPK